MNIQRKPGRNYIAFSDYALESQSPTPYFIGTEAGQIQGEGTWTSPLNASVARPLSSRAYGMGEMVVTTFGTHDLPHLLCQFCRGFGQMSSLKAWPNSCTLASALSGHQAEKLLLPAASCRCIFQPLTRCLAKFLPDFH